MKQVQPRVTSLDVQTVLLASKPEVKAMPMIKGLIMNASAIDATRTWVTRIQEPLAGFANLLIPMWSIVPPSDPTRYHREPAEVCVSHECSLVFLVLFILPAFHLKRKSCKRNLQTCIALSDSSTFVKPILSGAVSVVPAASWWVCGAQQQL